MNELKRYLSDLTSILPLPLTSHTAFSFPSFHHNLFTDTHHSSQTTLVTSPSTSTLATSAPNVPFASRSITTTRPSICSPTAASVPFLLRENCRGKRPPAGASCRNASAPVAGSMDHTCSESEGILVALAGLKFGRAKRLSLRDEVRRYFPSGETRTSAAAAPGGAGVRGP